MPIAFLEGSDYEMGYQYGMQLHRHLKAACSDAWVRALKLGDPRHPTAPDRDAVIRDLDVYRRLLQEYMPEQLEQMRGMLDALSRVGVGVDEYDLLLIQAGVNRRLAAEASGHADLTAEKSCCSWSAWGNTTTGGQLICSDSFDGDYTQQVCVLAFPAEGSPFVSTAAVGELSSHAAYSLSGWFFGNSGGNGRRLKDWGYGLRWTSVIQHCVRFARDAESARKMLEGWPHALPENYHLVDRSRDAMVIELTAESMHVRRPGDHGEGDYLYSTNNYLCQDMRVACDPSGTTEYVPYGGWPGNAGVPRNLELKQFLSFYGGSVDLRFAKMMWRFPGDLPPPDDRGWSNMICRMSNNRVAIVLPDEGPYGEFHLCTGPVGRVVHQFKSSTFPVDGTHSFVRMRLHATPEEVAEQMYYVARDDVARAHHALARLQATHCGYAGLNEMKVRAHRLLFRGKDSLYQGLLSGREDRIQLLSDAASDLACAQAVANQVVEFVEPPPTRPDDLGLDPWEQTYSVEAEYEPGYPRR